MDSILEALCSWLSALLKLRFFMASGFFCLLTSWSSWWWPLTLQVCEVLLQYATWSCEALTAKGVFQPPNLTKDLTWSDTVDGSEIRPASWYGKFLPLFTRFYTSQLVQNFFHQRYHPKKWTCFLTRDHFKLVPRCFFQASSFRRHSFVSLPTTRWAAPILVTNLTPLSKWPEIYKSGTGVKQPLLMEL